MAVRVPVNELIALVNVASSETTQGSRQCGGVQYPVTVASICVRDRRVSRPGMFAASNHIQRRHGRMEDWGAKSGYEVGISYEGLRAVPSKIALGRCI